MHPWPFQRRATGSHLDLLDLLLQAADVSVRLGRGLLDLHDRHHRVDLVLQHTDHRHDLKRSAKMRGIKGA